MHSKQLIWLRATQTHRKGMVKPLKLKPNILSLGYDLIYQPGLLSFYREPSGLKTSQSHKNTTTWLPKSIQCDRLAQK